jgi:hypothetical protein
MTTLPASSCSDITYIATNAAPIAATASAAAECLAQTAKATPKPSTASGSGNLNSSTEALRGSDAAAAHISDAFTPCNDPSRSRT